jgi:peptidoglycan/LPS O-acetylase OafA/YrhL
VNSQAKNENVPDQQGGIKPRDLVEGGLLYIGIPAVTLYPLGFIALGVQLWRDPSFPYHDFTTIWEAVSLIPQRVVVATGIRLIYTSLIATILGAAIGGLFFELLLWRRKGTGEEGSRLESLRRSHLWSIPLLLLLPLLASPLLIRGDLPIDSRHDNDAFYVTGFVIFALVGGGIFNLVRSRRRDDWFILGLGTAYTAAIFAAMCLAATQTPALSLVRVHVPEHGISGAEACSDDIHGNTYVKLEEGLFYWHLYNKEGLFAIPETELHRIEYVHCADLLNRN